MKNLRIGITGATGTVGQHVTRACLKRGLYPILYIRASSVVPDEFSKCQTYHLDLNNPSATFFYDVGVPDILIHLAWEGLPNYRSLHHFEQELPRQYSFLKEMIEAGVKNLVVTGTCFEYGMRSGPLDEEMATRPENPYGFAKDTLRKQLEFLWTAEKFNLIWARLFYCYGKGQSSKSLFPQLESAVQRGESEFPMSGGEQLRDFLPLETIGEILVDLALQKAHHGVVNVCSGNPVSVRSWVEEIIKKNKWKIKLKLGEFPYPDYEPMAFWGNRKKLNKITGVRL